ncbi:Rv3654c family TadE-like protein [Streptomyces sp. NPDC056291]|uniref:Rv3654c family TadE-like protein n=1 Tax=Streptomyces sp. NPDC056291 TaxID=3345772 RepID=UPI0035DEE1E8
MRCRIPVLRDFRRLIGGGRGEPRRSDRGSATVWSVGAIALLCVVFGIGLALGQAVVDRHRAAGAADLAALAAAGHWAEGGAAACARADEVARAQGTRLVRCAIVGDTSDVTAAAGRGPFTAEVRARAGQAAPADAPVGPAGPAGPGEHDRGAAGPGEPMAGSLGPGGPMAGSTAPVGSTAGMAGSTASAGSIAGPTAPTGPMAPVPFTRAG